ncbi:hypothetical protein NW752_001296 [Fusarium irregulare]|uniref:Cell wall cysteine-rich protein n=1 Tax=Fusarium irregulare TaxID=2494466 RepID=A0A9W8PIB6_9HYPO|nr:hypothetical protein NW766_010875 [Fusarium irregulare]KAJ4026356.1 hypothetical protein NW752_001296 [Fusarium irregulare]
MTRLRDVAVLFASSVVLAQDPHHILDGSSSGLLTTPLGTQASTLGSCLMGSACQKVGKKITIDDILISTDAHGNTKCCPQGTTFNGVSCVYPKSTVCPPNMHFANGVCILTSGPVCEDKSLVPTKDGCASKVPPTCPPETVLDNGQCVLRKEPTCPGGKKIVSGLCITDQVPKCPEKGFRPQGNLCVHEDGPTCHQDWLKVVDGKCVHIKEPVCPDRTKPVGGRCIHEQSPTCPTGFRISGDTCVHERGPSCPSGSTYRNGVCEYSRPPICKEGSLIDGQCSTDKAPECPSGYKFDKAAFRCQRRDTLQCQAGYVNRWDRVSDKIACCPKDFGGFDGTFCTQDYSGSGKCPPDSELRDTKCVTTPGRHPDCDGGKGFVEKGVCYKKEEAFCPSPLKLLKDKCVYETDPYCTDGKLSPTRNECIIEGPNCPSDSIVIDNECVSNIHIPECPAGLKQQGNSCIGEKILSCPAGTTRSGDYCIYGDVQPGCKDGLVLLGDKCVTRTTSKCPEDTMPEGEYCVSIRSPGCPEPDYVYSLERRACVHRHRPSCLPPFYLKNGRCVIDTLPVCPTDTVRSGDSCITRANCSGDYTLVGDRCISNKGPECPDPFTEFDEKTGSCISRSQTPSCTDGATLSGGKCVAKADCPPDTTPMGDYCVSYRKPRCEDGFTLENGECVLKKGPTCPAGYIARGTDCYSIKKPVCPADSVMDGDRCIIGVNPDCIILGTCPEIA